MRHVLLTPFRYPLVLVGLVAALLYGGTYAVCMAVLVH